LILKNKYQRRGAKSKLWKQIIVDCLGKVCQDLKYLEEVSALGIAIYLNAALEGERKLPHITEKFVKRKEEILPNKRFESVYNNYYQIYQKCYPALLK
jgi:sugar (pentulose or hexulose) kinase